jgi:hypothetical protein
MAAQAHPAVWTVVTPGSKLGVKPQKLEGGANLDDSRQYLADYIDDATSMEIPLTTWRLRTYFLVAISGTVNLAFLIALIVVLSIAQRDAHDCLAGVNDVKKSLASSGSPTLGATLPIGPPEQCPPRQCPHIPNIPTPIDYTSRFSTIDADLTGLKTNVATLKTNVATIMALVAPSANAPVDHDTIGPATIGHTSGMEGVFNVTALNAGELNRVPNMAKLTWPKNGQYGLNFAILRILLNQSTPPPSSTGRRLKAMAAKEGAADLKNTVLSLVGSTRRRMPEGDEMHDIPWPYSEAIASGGLMATGWDGNLTGTDPQFVDVMVWPFADGLKNSWGKMMKLVEPLWNYNHAKHAAICADAVAKRDAAKTASEVAPHDTTLVMDAMKAAFKYSAMCVTGMSPFMTGGANTIKKVELIYSGNAATQTYVNTDLKPSFDLMLGAGVTGSNGDGKPPVPHMETVFVEPHVAVVNPHLYDTFFTSAPGVVGKIGSTVSTAQLLAASTGSTGSDHIDASATTYDQFQAIMRGTTT